MQHANIYSEFNKRTHKLEKIANVLKDHQHLLQWGPEERILDAGCGPGDITANVISPWLPQDFRLLVGADVSPPVISHALTCNASAKVTFDILDIAGDITDFTRKEEYSIGFDKIFSFYTLQWLRDLEQGVENLFKLLRTGGQMLLLFPVDRLFQKTFQEVSGKEPWHEYLRDVSRKIPPSLTRTEPSREFKELLLDAGFEVVKCEVQGFHSHFDCVADVKDLIESLDQGVDCIPNDLRARYLQDCFEVLQSMEVLEKTDSGLILTQSMLVTVAKKP